MANPQFLKTLEAALVRVFSQLTDEERELAAKKIEELYQQHRQNIAAKVERDMKSLEGLRRRL